MFVGQHEHALDDKGRVVLPSGYRAYFEEKGYLTWLGSCIGLWTGDGFQAVAGRWKEALDGGVITQLVFRKLMNGVREVRLDTAGRISLPRELLAEHAFIDQLVVAGRYDRIEIWSADRYAAEMQTESAEESLAETVSRLGL
jgi:MraZ protein